MKKIIKWVKYDTFKLHIKQTGLNPVERIVAPLLCAKRIVIELRPPQFQPKQGAPYQPPSLPQLIFHFSSRAYRMRDVSISCQSFPGLCVTCVVISVWLTGSVVSHCPAASDSRRLTAMMSRGEARCVRQKTAADVREDDGRKKETHSHTRETLVGGNTKKGFCV